MSGYLPTVPTGFVNLDTDYLALQTNFAVANTAFGVNHTPFSVAGNQGKHKFVEMPTLGALTANSGATSNAFTYPPGLATGEGTLFSNTNSITTKWDLIYTPGTSGQGYQMTYVDNANYATFGTYSQYVPPTTPTVVNQVGGWTFLPGGLIMQYGHMKATANSQIVYFPKQFSDAASPYSLSIVAKNTSNNWGYSATTTLSFTFSSQSGIGQDFYWSAIGR